MSMCTKVWVCAQKYEYVHKRMSMCTKVWVCALKYEYVHKSMSMCTKVWVCAQKYEYVHKTMWTSRVISKIVLRILVNIEVSWLK